MSFPARYGKILAIIGVAVLIGAAIVWSAFQRSPTTVVTYQNNTTDTTRQQYSELYQAAWRQDEGRGNVLMTATLFVSPIIDLLGRDGGKSEMENQLYRVVQDVPDNQIAIFLTIDSVAGSQSDQAIRDSLTLTANNMTFPLASWNPLIFPSRVVNVSTPVNSQAGVAMFTADGIINWNSISNLQLTSRNIGGVDERNFIWAQPGLLSAVQ